MCNFISLDLKSKKVECYSYLPPPNRKSENAPLEKKSGAFLFDNLLSNSSFNYLCFLFLKINFSDNKCVSKLKKLLT